MFNDKQKKKNDLFFLILRNPFGWSGRDVIRIRDLFLCFLMLPAMKAVCK